MSSLRDMHASASCNENHDLYRLLVDLEARSTFSFQPTRWLGDVATHLVSAATRGLLEVAKSRSRERRAFEAALPADLRYVKGWPPRLPSLAEAGAIARTRTVVAGQHDLASPYLTATAVRDRFAALIASAPNRTMEIPHAH